MFYWKKDTFLWDELVITAQQLTSRWDDTFTWRHHFRYVLSYQDHSPTTMGLSDLAGGTAEELLARDYLSE